MTEGNAIPRVGMLATGVITYPPEMGIPPQEFVMQVTGLEIEGEVQSPVALVAGEVDEPIDDTQASPAPVGSGKITSS